MKRTIKVLTRISVLIVLLFVCLMVSCKNKSKWQYGNVDGFEMMTFIDANQKEYKGIVSYEMPEELKKQKNVIITIPSGTEAIVDELFKDYDNIKEVILPDSLIYLDMNICSNASFDQIVIPKNVEEIDFYECEDIHLKTIIVDKKNKTYDSRNNCNAIIKTEDNELIFGISTSLIPEGVETIGYQAFQNCEDLTTIKLPESLKFIQSESFANCKSLKSIYIPKNVEWIFENPFIDCEALESIKVDSANLYYDSRDNCNAIMRTGENALEVACKNTIIPESCEWIYGTPFRNCKDIKKIFIPKNVQLIDFNQFDGCDSLVEIEVDKDNPYFDSRENCNAIIETSTNTLLAGCNGTMIPETIVAISDYAFCGVHHLKSIHIPANCNDIILGGYAFFECNDLETITIDENNLVYDSRENCNAIIEKETNVLLLGCKNTIIPSNVTSIGPSAFFGNKGITSYTIPSTINTIDRSAFSQTGLKNITIPSNVTTLGDSVFAQCDDLEKVFIEQGIETIPEYTFFLCEDLETIVLPKSIKTIAVGAFTTFKNITIEYNGTISDWKKIEVEDSMGLHYVTKVKCLDGELSYDELNFMYLVDNN